MPALNSTDFNEAVSAQPIEAVFKKTVGKKSSRGLLFALEMFWICF